MGDDVKALWPMESIVAECRAQARQNLDPDFTRFMVAAADLIEAQAREIERLHLGTGEVGMTLIERIEAATGADRELDAEIAVAARIGLPGGCDWAFKFPKWEADRSGQVLIIGNVNGNGDYIAGKFTSPRYTAGIDAALTLMPDGLFPTIDFVTKRVWLRDAKGFDSPGGPAYGFAQSVPNSICAAALRAREAQP